MRDVKCVARDSGTSDTERAYERQFLLEARIKFPREGLDPDLPSLPMWRPCFVGQWEVVGADDAVDVFEGTGPGCRGAAVQPCTAAAPTNWAVCAEAWDKYCQGIGTLEPEPAWKRAYEVGLDPHDIE
eukprot:jgi/Tetstr1/424019/TSEL_014630.t1